MVTPTSLTRGSDVGFGLFQVVAGGVGLGGDVVDRLGDGGGRPGQLLHGGRGLGDPAGLLGGGGGQLLDRARELVGVASEVRPGRLEGPRDVPQDQPDDQHRKRDPGQGDQHRQQDGQPPGSCHRPFGPRPVLGDLAAGRVGQLPEQLVQPIP
jgi:hypothetical protein